MESQLCIESYSINNRVEYKLIFKLTGLIEWEFAVFNFGDEDHNMWIEFATSHNHGGIGLVGNNDMAFTMDKIDGKIIFTSDAHPPWSDCYQRMAVPAEFFDKKILHHIEILRGGSDT